MNTSENITIKDLLVYFIPNVIELGEVEVGIMETFSIIYSGPYPIATYDNKNYKVKTTCGCSVAEIKNNVITTQYIPKAFTAGQLKYNPEMTHYEAKKFIKITLDLGNDMEIEVPIPFKSTVYKQLSKNLP